MNYCTVDDVKKRWGEINAGILSNYDNVSVVNQYGDKVPAIDASDDRIESLIATASSEIDAKCYGHYFFPLHEIDPFIRVMATEKTCLLIEVPRHYSDDARSIAFSVLRKNFEENCTQIRRGIRQLVSAKVIDRRFYVTNIGVEGKRYGKCY